MHIIVLVGNQTACLEPCLQHLQHACVSGDAELYLVIVELGAGQPTHAGV